MVCLGSQYIPAFLPKHASPYFGKLGKLVSLDGVNLLTVDDSKCFLYTISPRSSIKMYTISEVPHPPSEANTTHYTTIRLLGLRTDAHAFGSTYERESQFTRDQWQERLGTPGRTTFLAYVNTTLDGREDKFDCIGTAGVLGPSMLETAGFFPPEHLATKNEAVYIVVGMWMHPDHRRRGLGRGLIEAIKEKVWANVSETRRKVLLLQVHNHNTQAKSLYKGLGFIDGGPDGDSGEVWMSFQNDKAGGG